MEKIVLVSFGRGGTTAYFAPRPGYGVCTLQGYAGPEDFVASHDPARYDIDGALAVDVRDAVLTPAGCRWVFAGPLVNPKLADGEVNACPEPDPLFVEALAMYPENRPALASRKVGGLDEVSPAEYRPHARAQRSEGAGRRRVVRSPELLLRRAHREGGLNAGRVGGTSTTHPTCAHDEPHKEETMARPKHTGAVDWSAKDPGRELTLTCRACAASESPGSELVANHERSLRRKPDGKVWHLSSYVTFRYRQPDGKTYVIDVHDVRAATAENALRALHGRLRRKHPLAKSWEVRWESHAGNWTHRAEVAG